MQLIYTRIVAGYVVRCRFLILCICVYTQTLRHTARTRLYFELTFGARAGTRCRFSPDCQSLQVPPAGGVLPGLKAWTQPGDRPFISSPLWTQPRRAPPRAPPPLRGAGVGTSRRTTCPRCGFSKK